MPLRALILSVSSLLLAASSTAGTVLGTDFDAIPVGLYPFDSREAVELVAGARETVRVATYDLVPPVDRTLATAPWIRDGRFLLVDTRDRNADTLLRVRYCRGEAGAERVLVYDRLLVSEHGASVTLADPARSRSFRREPCPSALADAEVRIRAGTLAFLDNFGTTASGLDHFERLRLEQHGGRFLGEPFESIPPGPYFASEDPAAAGRAGIRLLRGDPWLVRMVVRRSDDEPPALPGELGIPWRHPPDRYLCVTPPPGGEALLALDFELVDYPGCRVEMVARAAIRSGEGVEISAGGSAAGVTKRPWGEFRGSLTRDLGPANGRRSEVLVRLRPGAVLCLGEPVAVLRPERSDPSTLRRKVEAELLVAERGPKRVFEDAVARLGSDRLAPVEALAAYGRDTELWSVLGWERSLLAVASRNGRYCVARTSGRGEWGFHGSAMLCLLDGAAGRALWTRPAWAVYPPLVNDDGWVVTAHRSAEGFGLEFVDRTGTARGNALFEPSRRASVGKPYEAIAWTPEQTEVLVTAHRGRAEGRFVGDPDEDPSRTDLYLVERTGEIRWRAPLGRVRHPEILFRKDDTRIVAGDLALHGGRDRLVVLTREGEIRAAYDMDFAFSPGPDSLFFGEDGLRFLDLEEPDAARRVDPEELYPFLLSPERRTHLLAQRQLVRHAFTRYDSDPALARIVDVMREDSTYASAVHELDRWRTREEEAARPLPRRE